MAKVTRIAYQNRIHTPGAVIVPSSEETPLPRAALLRALHSDVLRFKTGWTVAAGVNDHIQIDRGGGPSNAFIAPGYYPTGALLATAVIAALEAADATPVWSCTYSSSTHKFTISSNIAFQLLCDPVLSVGPAAAHQDLGYTSTDKASATSHVAENVAYQSRHTIVVDLGAAAAFAVGIVRGSNVSTAGTIRLQADATSLATRPLNESSSMDLDQVLAGNADRRIAFFGSLTKQFLRLVIEDVQNPAGYNELGVLFVGPYSQPAVGESIEWGKAFEHLSENSMAVGGALHQVQRSRRTVYSLVWRVSRTSGDVAILEALDLAMPMGKHFFIAFDATDNPTTDTMYGFLRAGLTETLEGGRLLVLPVQFAEALG